MRLRKIIGLLFVSLLLMPGCNDLVQTNPNEPTVASFWEDEEDAISGINGTYNVLQSYFGTYKRWSFFVWDHRSDLVRSESPWQALANVSKFQFTSYDFEVNAQTWLDHYSGVFRANQVIQYVPEIEMNQDLRARIVAEARFLRSLMFYNLAILYGDVPMPLEPQEPSARPEQVPREEIWVQIESDLQAAAEVLPSKGEYAPENEGRATREAALALLGKAHLQQREWEEAASAFREVINSGRFDLMEDYTANFTNMNENNAESVFEVQFTDDQRLDSGVSGDFRAQQSGPPILTYGDSQPTQWFFDQFFQEQTVDGNQDPRIDATFYYPGGPEMYGQTYRETYPGGRTIPYFKKYTEFYLDAQTLDSAINKRVIRYAGVLLLAAEALNETGDQATAAQYVQQVRDRVDMPDREAEFASMSQEELRRQIAHEQILELGAENERIRYLLRHDLMDGALVRGSRRSRPGISVLSGRPAALADPTGRSGHQQSEHRAESGLVTSPYG